MSCSLSPEVQRAPLSKERTERKSIFKRKGLPWCADPTNCEGRRPTSKIFSDRELSCGYPSCMSRRLLEFLGFSGHPVAEISEPLRIARGSHRLDGCDGACNCRTCRCIQLRRSERARGSCRCVS